MFPVPAPSGSRPTLPHRTVSLGAQQAATFSQIEEELRDVRRVCAQGQEEDLRMALSRTIGRVEELTSLLRDAYKVQTDLQTELTLAKSNLQLALANNEMLEDALKRDGPGNAKDVGWRRWSAREQRERELAAESRRQSMDSLGSSEALATSSPIPPSPMPSTAAGEGRFFKFRFGGATTPGNQSPRIPGSMSPNLNGTMHASHLTSASLPSLVPTRDKDKELEEMISLLDKERKAHKDAQAAKEALEAELESLSQALFEEANKMVAAERMKLAEAEEELKEAQAEKEALRSALRLVERQSSRPPSVSPERSRPQTSMHSHKRSSSSAIAVKSLPSSAPSSPRSAIRVVDDLSAPSRATVPPPLDLPEVGLANPDVAPSPFEETSPTDATSSGENLESSESSSLAPPENVEPPPSASPQPGPSSGPSPTPSPTPSPGQYAYASARPLNYFDAEESPWADARSSTPVSAAF